MFRLLRQLKKFDETSTDEVLVACAMQGQNEAFQRLFERHVVSVRRFLKDLLRDPHQADDATQETFARVHAQLSRGAALNGGSAHGAASKNAGSKGGSQQLGRDLRFKPWLFGVARNVAFELRRVRTHDTLEDDETVPVAVLPSPDPEAMLLDRELEGHFDRALDTLKPDRRAALLMRLDHGLSYDEIAEAMGWTLPVVKNEIHRARLKVRQLLVPHLGASHQGGTS